MSQSKFDIANRALVRVGADRIADFTGGTVESEVAGLEYEPLVEERLSGTMPDGAAIEWRFAMELKKLGSPLVDVPADKWKFAYNLPADLLVIRAVRRNDTKISFDRYGDKLFCDDNQDVVIEYTFRQDEIAFPPYFRSALVAELASIFALSINRDLTLAAGLSKDALNLWSAARLADSRGRTTESLQANRLLSARFGRR